MEKGLVLGIVAIVIALMGTTIGIMIPGPEGDQGPQGIQGIQGVQGPQGDLGPPGDNILFDWNETKLGVKQESEVNFTYVDLQGPQGIQGPQGPTGTFDGEFHLVNKWQRTSNYNSSNFFVNGYFWRITYVAVAGNFPSIAGFNFFIYPKETTTPH